MLKHLLSIDDLNRAQLEQLLSRAKKYPYSKQRESLHGSLVSLLFLEPSTRTELSFNAAYKSFYFS